MSKRRKGAKLASPYPWKEWFDRAEFVLHKGVDYFCQPHGMSAMIRNRAYQRGFKAEVAIHESGRIDVKLTKEGS